MKKEAWTHKELLDDLEVQTEASRLGIHFREAALGSRMWRGGHVAVPDLLTIQKSYSKPDITICEVKATRTDLLSDVGEGKWRRYLPVCERLYFCLPQGMEWKDVLGGEPVGIRIRTETGWRTVKKAPKRTMEKWDVDFALALLFLRKGQDVQGNRLESKRSYVRQLQRVAKDVTLWERTVNEAIERKRKEVGELEDKAKAAIRDARRNALDELRKEMGIGEGYDSHYCTELQGIVEELITRPAEKALKEGLERLLSTLKDDKKTGRKAG